jgi:hypothetical protein
MSIINEYASGGQLAVAELPCEYALLLRYAELAGACETKHIGLAAPTRTADIWNVHESMSGGFYIWSII